MRKLSEIIESAKTNQPVETVELKYAVIALTGLVNMAMTLVFDILSKSTDMFIKMRIENLHNTYAKALGKSPQEWLGWDNDPENPEYQKFHAMGTRLVEKALSGLLPNQKQAQMGREV